MLARRNYVGLLTVSALGLIAVAPVYLSYVVLGEGVLPLGIPNFAADAYELVVGCIIGGAVVVATSDAYLGRPIDVTRSMRVGWHRAWPLVVSGVLVFLAIIAGLALLIIPGLLAVVRLFAVTPAIVLEGKGTIAAIRRSAALSRGYGWKILSTAGLATVLFILVFIALTFVLGQWTSSEATAYFLTSALTTLASPFLFSLVTLVYYDVRVVREGVDIEMMATALDNEGGIA